MQDLYNNSLLLVDMADSFMLAYEQLRCWQNAKKDKIKTWFPLKRFLEHFTEAQSQLLFKSTI